MVKMSLCLKAMQLRFMGCMQVQHIPVKPLLLIEVNGQLQAVVLNPW